MKLVLLIDEEGLELIRSEGGGELTINLTGAALKRSKKVYAVGSAVRLIDGEQGIVRKVNDDGTYAIEVPRGFRLRVHSVEIEGCLTTLLDESADSAPTTALTPTVITATP